MHRRVIFPSSRVTTGEELGGLNLTHLVQIYIHFFLVNKLSCMRFSDYVLEKFFCLVLSWIR